jgi:endonuclease/exonuclease/phosphatase family metal-dependent hydrolase
MAQIRLMSWNIEIFGPKKYALTPNSSSVIRFTARTVADKQANVLVLQELTSGVAEQVCFSVAAQLRHITHAPWQYKSMVTRPAGDREAHGIFWRTDQNFAITVDGNGADNIMLSELEFPNKWAKREGRRPLIAVFRTTDTGVYFAVTNYHAPARTNQAALGVEALAQTISLYRADVANYQRSVTARLLAGDYNLGATHPYFGWLTQPLPPVPPPANAANPGNPVQGAGTTALLATDTMYTHYAKLDEVIDEFGANINLWANDPAAYRDLQLDNMYSRPAVTAGEVIDQIAAVKRLVGVGAIARVFRQNNDDGSPAFPNSARIPPPLHLNVSYTSCAYLLYRYAISDHLPVFVTATI